MSYNLSALNTIFTNLEFRCDANLFNKVKTSHKLKD